MSVNHFWTAFAFEPFMNALLIGLSMASIWLIAALGLAIVYGTMGVINMAHGEFVMLGAYTAYVLETFVGVPFLLCVPCCFLVVGLIGAGIERGLIRYLYRRPLDTLLATWGLSLVLIQGVRLIMGPEPKNVSSPDWLNASLRVWVFELSWFRVFIFIVTIATFAVTWWLMQRTRMGLMVRAVMQNKEMAAAHGIDSGTVFTVTFAYGAGLAGLAGSMFGAIKNVFPDMGAGYIVEAFLVVVVGGVGSLMGSLVSATGLGEIYSVFAYFTNGTFAKFWLFLLVVIFLRFRPQGLFAESLARR
ncbi:MAG: urea ABC transporter permease subunit UrtB [Betaproteobacteria bacterium]|nr:urea ABC transporter permease subunit UrtB [Betaproteobacteria bacterium]MBL8533335.1 urea ABC transporter permease subunit UrtB [Betaproteobacteria bacterium]